VTAKSNGTATYTLKTPSDARKGTHKVEGIGSAGTRTGTKFTIT
jgi:hypothetical protein